MKQLFGTDGVRGVVGDLITSQFAYKLGQSIASFLNKSQGKKTVLVCHDTRVSAEILQKNLVDALTEFGIDVVLGGIMPTPAVHYLAKTHNFSLAVMITASHNPGEYNGFKLITSDGLKFDDEQESEISQIFYDENFVKNGEKGTLKTDESLIYDWIDFLKKSVNANFSGLKIALDCANGASFFVAPKVFSDLGAEVVAVCNTKNGELINKDCGSTHLEKIIETVKQNGCDFGFAFDGDADRVNAVFADGSVFGGEELMYCCFRFLQENKMLKTNEMITPVVSNGAIDKVLAEMGFNVIRCPVGGKHIQRIMTSKEISFGAENNGHIVWGDFNKCSCGMLTSLFLTKFSKTHNLKDVCSELVLFKQLNETMPADDEFKQKVESKQMQQNFEEFNKQLFVGERFIIRPSGTEPIIRIMVEGENEEHLKEMMEKLKVLLKSA